MNIPGVRSKQVSATSRVYSSSCFCALHFGDRAEGPARCLAWIKPPAQSKHQGAGLQMGIAPLIPWDWARTWCGWMRRGLQTGLV